MNVRDIMCQGLLTCRPGDTLAEAASKMWNGDCGVAPVVAEGRLLGVVTDRDICMAASSNARTADEISVDEIMTVDCITCRPDDDLRTVLALLGKHQLRRLPVVTTDGELVGIVSMNDLASEAKARGRAGAPTFKDIVVAMQNIGRHRDLPAVA